ncbi:MAG TPA: hypothetical protein VK787_04455 [Puia sp.]|jgi:hypothetical protein|nr:hypothetical protein [Puia sp.]
MKKIFILALFVSGIAYGQKFNNDSLLKSLPGKPLSEYVFPDISNNNLFQNPNTFWLNNKDEKEIQGLMADKNATFSHNTSLGSVYILSEDGMACLVPNLQKVERMPEQKLYHLQNADRMPNAFPKQKILMIPIK